jgi:hypothetical protein
MDCRVKPGNDVERLSLKRKIRSHDVVRLRLAALGPRVRGDERSEV